MKMNQRGKGNDNFSTPPYIFRQLNDIFKFTLDAAADDNNHKCEYYFTEKDDGLFKCWTLQRVFCNPPFSKKADFIHKAHKEVQENNCPICVMILPLNSMDTKVWHEVIESKYHYEILKGRIAFINPQTGQPQKGNNSGTVIVYFKKKIEV